MTTAESVLSAGKWRRRKLIQRWVSALSASDPDISLVEEVYLTAATPMLPPRDGLDAADAGDEMLTAVEQWFLPRCAPSILDGVKRLIELGRIECQTARGTIYQRLTRDDDARVIWEDNIERYQRLGCPNQAAVQRINLGSQLARLGDRRGALAVLRSVYMGPDVVTELRREAMYHAASAVAVTTTSLSGSDRAEARRLIAEADSLTAAGDEPGRFGAMLREQGRPDDPWVSVMELMASAHLGAIRLMAVAAVEGKRMPPIPLVDNPIRDEVMRGVYLAEHGDEQEALEVLRASGDAAAKQGQLWWYIAARSQMAWLLMDTDLAEAAKAAYEAVDAAESMRGGLADEQARMHVGGVMGPYDVAIAVTAAIARATNAKLRAVALPRLYELSERARSRRFLEMLGDTVPPLPGSSLAATEAELRGHLVDQVRILAESGGGARRRALAEVRTTERKLERVVRRLSRGGPAEAEYAEMRHGTPRSYHTVRALLASSPERATLFSYYQLHEELMLLLVGRADLAVPASIPIRLPKGLLATVSTRLAGDKLRPEAVARTSWQDELAPLVAPIADWTDPGDVAWIVPHGQLHPVPMHALTLGDAPVLQRNPVCYTPSASTMSYCQGRRTGRFERATVLADADPTAPLAYSRTQARAIARLFATSMVRIGPEATAAALIEAARDADVVHVACHGQFDVSDPQRSGVWLAGAEPDRPELFDVSQLMRVRLDTDLVTLTACRSGMSAHRPGDELLGLARAVLYSGAAATVLSLWSVEDVSTGLLMTDFYRRLSEGSGHAVALRGAALSLRDTSFPDAIRACESARDDATAAGDEPAELLLNRDIANLYHRVGRFDDAYTAWESLSRRLPEPQQVIARAGMTRARHAGRRPRPPDDDLKPFSHPYYWAGFALTGDWR
ncbi:CHAT domain-containing protein [Micromonospora sp. NPDC006766]|uniref:CHAT domain-containing protein n=1 Tax=Micromonospora sp. NPDC006766 TaxID=3154778 RepID=UPI0033EE3B6F